MKKLLVIDGNSILSRAFYGIRPLTTRDGLFTNAIYGMVNIVSKHISEQKPDYAAVAFDVKAPTFRHERFSDYKGTRKPTPPEFLMQLPYAKDVMRAMGIHTLELAGYEADDILGTLSAEAEKEEIETCVATGDKDSFQLISDKTFVMLATNAEPVKYDTEKFTEKYGVLPSQYIDVKALMGDGSDNIPGVPGIGEKTALKLISDYGSLDGIYEALEEKPLTPSVKKKLAEGRESAYLSQWLATIKRDVPLGITLAELEYKGMDKRKMLELCMKLEFSAFIKKFSLDEAGTHAMPEKTEKSNAPERTAIYFDDERAYVFDGNVSRTFGFDDGAALLSGGGSYVVCDKKGLLHRLAEAGYSVSAECDDVMLMGYICGAGESDFSLPKLTSRLLMHESESGEDHAKDIYSLYHMLHSELEKTEQFSLYKDIELPLSSVLFEMEREGFTVDTKKLAEFSRRLDEMKGEYASRIYMLAGREFNINSPKQLGTVLFEEMGFPAIKKTKSGYSTGAEILEKLRPYSPIIDDILDYRQVDKLKSTYADGLCKVADEKGRVHTSFRQALTATGRLSSTEPNLQNIPIKTELGRELRKFFTAKNDDYLLIDADYSQIELRLLAAVSGDENMIHAFESGFDIHTDTAMRIFGVSKDMVTVEMRKRAKAVNFGIMYGMGEFSLAGDLHISRKQAGEYIENYLCSYPKVREYLHNITEQAKRDLYVKTIFGRRRYIPELASQKHTERAFGERVAMNSPIQGSAADIIKAAMINVSRRLKKEGLDARLLLQVHDELIIEAHVSCAERAMELLKYEMENAVKLAVPLTVEAGIGKTWYDAK